MGTTVTDPLVGRLIDGRYEVRSRIARGGMATVYLAIDRRLDREVALKVMHPHLAEGSSGSDFVARFRREARTAARLTHPGLVAVFDQGVDGETSYLTMEYVNGENLRRRLGELGSLPLGEALRVTESVLDALTPAHRTGMVHRDIKPENVLIDGENRIKLADFGLARAVTEVTSTTTGTVLGTVAYLAPELVVRGTADARTDVYAAGIVLYEMITGRQPFTGSTPIQVAFQHVNCDVPAPSALVDWLPSEVDELVAALAARDPADRPLDASAALVVLRRTRAALDASTLERRADVPPTLALHAASSLSELDYSSLPDARSGEDGPAAPREPRHRDDEPTTAIYGLGGSTIALPIGLGLRPAPDAGLVAAPTRPRHRWWRWIAPVAVVLLAASAGGWWYLAAGPGAYTRVPDLIDAPEANAVKLLDEQGLTGVRAEEFSDEIVTGHVIRTEPKVDQPVRKEGTVTYVVSKGVDLVTIPDGVVGVMQDVAEAVLKTGDLGVAYGAEEYADTATIGSVLSATLPGDAGPAEPGAQVKRRTVVTLVLSKGPAPVTVTTVLGATVQAATAQLAMDGLTLTATEAFSDTVPAGQIIDQLPVASATAHRGDPIAVTVSKGPEMIPLPSVNGMKADKAQKALASAGFEVKIVYPMPGQFHPAGNVYDQSPAGGKDVTAPRGTLVTLSVF